MGHVIFIILHITVVLFGLVGLIITIPLHLIYAVMAGKEKTSKQKDYRTKVDNIKCPFCAELVKKEALICKHCGKDLPKIKIKEKELPKKVDDCPKCANFRKQKILKCFVCGKDLTYDNSGLNKDNYDINGEYHLTKKEKERML